MEDPVSYRWPDLPRYRNRSSACPDPANVTGAEQTPGASAAPVPGRVSAQTWYPLPCLIQETRICAPRQEDDVPPARAQSGGISVAGVDAAVAFSDQLAAAGQLLMAANGRIPIPMTGNTRSRHKQRPDQPGRTRRARRRALTTLLNPCSTSPAKSLKSALLTAQFAWFNLRELTVDRAFARRPYRRD